MSTTKIPDELLSSGVGTGASKLLKLDSSGKLPAVDGSNLTSLSSSNLTGALPVISGANLTGIETDTSVLENNIAMLGFYRATDHSKAKYNLVDQVIDEYIDATGVDASASTDEVLSSGYYFGQTSTTGNATGGTITTSGGYTYHVFHATALDTTTTVNFVTPGSGVIDYLIVGGGGSGRSTHAGTPAGGGGGDSQLFTNQTKAGGTYSIVSGGGGTGWTSVNNGVSSTAFGTTKAGGSYGYTTNSNGHIGTYYSQFALFGRSQSNTEGGGWFRGGGGAPCYVGEHGGADGGCGAGGHQWQSPASKWGGGGGSGSAQANAAGNGGHGVVLIRYLTDGFTAYITNDLSLVSTANTAETAPTTGDVVTLIENSTGTATLNTDIKGYVSRDSGTTWTQGTLTNEGDWGTNKKILAFHDLDISGQPSGTAMKYKITTHNQSASKETRIHATSLAWA